MKTILMMLAACLLSAPAMAAQVSIDRDNDGLKISMPATDGVADLHLRARGRCEDNVCHFKIFDKKMTAYFRGDGLPASLILPAFPDSSPPVLTRSGRDLVFDFFGACTVLGNLATCRAPGAKEPVLIDNKSIKIGDFHVDFAK